MKQTIVFLSLLASILFSMAFPSTAQAAGSADWGMYMTFSKIERNQSVGITVYNLPANQTFTVRIGPFYNFSRKAVQVATINSGNGGTQNFTFDIPQSAYDSEWVTVRLDSNYGRYVYNAFKNNTVDVNPPRYPTARVTPRPGGSDPITYRHACQITSSSSGKSVNANSSFDATWTVKNVGYEQWHQKIVDYKYLYGAKIQKDRTLFDLPETVKPGESIKITVDMVAPASIGYHHTTWGLAIGGVTICELPLSVYVK